LQIDYFCRFAKKSKSLSTYFNGKHPTVVFWTFRMRLSAQGFSWGQVRSTLYLTPMHAEAGLIKSMIANVHADLEHVKTAAEQLPIEASVNHDSLDFAAWKDRKALATAIKPIYTAVNAEVAGAALDEFEAGAWGQKSPTVVSA
jgi:hypothetical protein